VDAGMAALGFMSDDANAVAAPSPGQCTNLALQCLALRWDCPTWFTQYVCAHERMQQCYAFLDSLCIEVVFMFFLCSLHYCIMQGVCWASKNAGNQFITSRKGTISMS
jgi:hypothetical protein